MSSFNNKYELLKAYLKELKSVVVAFSSGVDSTFLLKVAADTLKDNVIAITIKSSSFPKRELIEAIEFCRCENIKHIIVEIDQLDIKGFRENTIDRCYLCKKALFQKIIEIAHKNNIENVIEGSNKDDDGDYRPGMIALNELNIISPLKYCALNKAEIRKLSKQLGLKTSEKQSFACLSSRFPYGEEITEEKLYMVEKSEQLLMDLGFHQLRVRIHGNIARIEVSDDEFDKILKNRKIIIEKFKEYGFSYVSMDIQGYRTGSMNEVL